MEPLCLNTPHLSKFLKENNVKINPNKLFSVLFERIITKALKMFPGEVEFNIAAVFSLRKFVAKTQADDPVVLYLNKLLHRILRKRNPGFRGDFIICCMEDLKMDGDALFFREKQIGVVLEVAESFVPMKMLMAAKRGKLLLYNGPIVRILSNKLNLAILSEFQDSNKFTREESEIIRKYVPWTRRVAPVYTTYGEKRIKLDEFLVSAKDDMVLKAGESYGGKDVLLGRHTAGDVWKDLVKEAISRKDWIAQEYIEPSSYMFQTGEDGCVEHQAVWGFFVFGDEYTGGFVRIMPKEGCKGAINSHLGAEASCIVDVEE
jgi:hypothetical protein